MIEPMTTVTTGTLTLLFLIAAALYSSVGHAGASAYLAAMALVGIAPQVMKPTALFLNVFVAAIATVKFARAGAFSWRIFWPFAITSVPFAFLGGRLTLPGTYYKIIVGIVLLYSAFRFFQARIPQHPRSAPHWMALAAGGGIGFLSGLTGVGGGIFLSPLLLLMNWAETRQTSGVAAAFILVNSVSGLLGNLSRFKALPEALPYWTVAVVIGGWIGAEYGSRRLNNMTIRRLLAVVLVIAGLKMIFV